MGKLFDVNLVAIESRVRNANEDLLSRCSLLLNRFQQIPGKLESVEDVAAAQQFAEQIDSAVRALRKGRLTNTRPFNDAVKRIKQIFEETERPLKSSLNEILGRITAQTLLSETVGKNEATDVIMVDADGAPIITAARSAPPQATDQRFPLKWSIDNFDRSKLDLEALRPYFTHAAILTACGKHLSENGPNTLSGATYSRIAQLK